MSFLYMGGQTSPISSYYFDTGAQRRLTSWRLVLGFMLLSVAMALVLARTVTSRVELISSESLIPTLSSPTGAPVWSNLPSSMPNTGNLQSDIDTWIMAHKGVDWAVSVSALEGGLSASVNADDTYALASIYKLFLLQPLANSVPSDTWATAHINSRTYADCVDAMLRVSDNACAESIGDKLGWARSEKYLRSLGYAKTAFLGNTTTGTANETSALLQNLYNSEGFDAVMRNTALQAMLAPKKTEGIRHGCNNCTVYNKIGDLNGYHNDVAIIEKNGKAYSVVIFSKTGSWQQIAELTKVISAHF